MYFSALNAIRQNLALRGIGVVSSSASSSSSSLPKLTMQANLMSGAFARATVGFIVNPITVLKVRYESDLYAYRSMTHAMRDIWKVEGMRGNKELGLCF